MRPKVKTFRSFEEADHADEEYYASLTPEQRIGMVWDLTVQVWEFMGLSVAETRLQKDVVVIIKPKR